VLCPLTVTVFVDRLNVAVTPVAEMKLAQPVFAVQPLGSVNAKLDVASKFVNATISAHVTE
jgi:hypothetical protein